MMSGLQEVRQAAAAYARPRTGRTALHQATRAQSSWLCQRLLENQADPLACEADGSSPLSIAENDDQCPVALRDALEQAALERNAAMVQHIRRSVFRASCSQRADH